LALALMAAHLQSNHGFSEGLTPQSPKSYLERETGDRTRDPLLGRIRFLDSYLAER
jgi:hypothetical protein